MDIKMLLSLMKEVDAGMGEIQRLFHHQGVALPELSEASYTAVKALRNEGMIKRKLQTGDRIVYMWFHKYQVMLDDLTEAAIASYKTGVLTPKEMNKCINLCVELRVMGFGSPDLGVREKLNSLAESAGIGDVGGIYDYYAEDIPVPLRSSLEEVLNKNSPKHSR